VTDAGCRFLRRLTALTSLGLAHADLTGAGLPHIAALTGLRHLDLHRCAGIAEGLERLSSLTALTSLRSPHGSGGGNEWIQEEGRALASVVCELPALERLALPSIGEATLWQAGCLTALRALQIWGCDGADLRALAAALTALTELDLGLVYGAPLGGPDAESLGRMPSLQRLTLGDAAFESAGAFFELRRLTTLVSLILKGCDGPSNVQQGSLQLGRVLLHLTRLTEAVFDYVYGLCDADLAALPTSLRSLEFEGDKITAVGIASLSRLTALTALSQQRGGADTEHKIPGFGAALAGVVAGGAPLRELCITCAAPDSLACLQGLSLLSSLTLRDFGPGALAQLSPLAGRLECLTLQLVLLGDEGLAPIARLSRLTSLDLRKLGLGQVTEAGLGALRALTALRVLQADLGGVTDAGLDHVLACPSLRRLSLKLDFNHAVTPAGLARALAHPALQFLRKDDGDGTIVERIASDDNEFHEWD
jgi:hypothetical protein